MISDLILLFKYRIGQFYDDFGKFFTPVEIPRTTTRSFDITNYRPLTIHNQNYYRESYFKTYTFTKSVWKSIDK